MASGEYTCNCPTGFFGKNCEALVGKWGTFGISGESDALLLIFGILGVATSWGTYHVVLEFEAVANTKIFAAFGCWLISATVITAINWRQCDSDRALICNPASIGPGGSFELYGIVMAMFMVQSIIALGLQRLVSTGCNPNGGGRLQRGAGLPLLALLCASPCIAVGIWMNPDRLSATNVDIVADIGVIYSWEAVTFGVLVPCLPIAAVLARVYYKQEHRHHTPRHQEFALDWEVPRPAEFHKTELAFAYFSGLLLPLFWVSYMVNEMQEFWSFADSKNRTGNCARRRELASLDGVRALSPVVCTLNLLALIWGMYIIVVFPAPLKWTASMYFGIVWCSMAVLTLLGLTLSLILSLSETREAAKKRVPENFWGYGKHGYDQNNCFLEVVCCIKRFVLSWTGQTCISGVNHFLAIVLFSYGLSCFGEVMTLSLKKFLYSGIGMTVFGVFTSFGSFVMRQKPKYKCLPVDDSFRLACVLKALLVMNKALIVYELSKIDMSDNQALRHWTMVVTVVCVMSIFILGLLTYAFEALKIYQDPKLVENVGVECGKRFVKMYSMSFVCCKLAASFFVLLGHIPDIAGCDSSPITFHGPRKHDSSVECIVCYVNNRPPGNAPPNPLCENESPINYNRCTTTCTKLFFSGGGEIAISLDVFVLVPLLWLPFAVYSNNEVARMLDGIWQTKRANSETLAEEGTPPPPSPGGPPPPPPGGAPPPPPPRKKPPPPPPRKKPPPPPKVGKPSPPAGKPSPPAGKPGPPAGKPGPPTGKHGPPPGKPGPPPGKPGPPTKSQAEVHAPPIIPEQSRAATPEAPPPGAPPPTPTRANERDRDPAEYSAIANLVHVVFKKECQDASNRIGLSSTVLGYRAIANLSHAIFLICFAFTVYFMFATGGGYYVDVGSICGVTETGGSICGPQLDAVQPPLRTAGRYVTCSIVGLNILMLLRFSYEKLPSLWCATESELLQRVEDLERQLLENQQGSE
eukprot:COSAG02_NODE_293_length_25438_cov_52.630254_5_plen_976_part_00